MLAKGAREGVQHADEVAGVVSGAARQADEAADEIVTVSSDALKILGGTCFAAGTPILTPTGPKRIENRQIGDEILTRDEHSPEAPTETSRVEQVFSLHANILELKVGGRVIETTSEHPFYVVEKGWVRAVALLPGDRLLGYGTESGTATGAIQKGQPPGPSKIQL